QPALRIILQAPPQLAFHPFEQRGVGLRIEAAHPPPVAGKPDEWGLWAACLHLPAALLFQNHPDMHILVPHRIRHIPEQLKLACPPLVSAIHTLVAVRPRSSCPPLTSATHSSLLSVSDLHARRWFPLFIV